MSSQTFVPRTQIQKSNTLYLITLFILHSSKKNIHLKKLYQLTLIQHFMDVIWPRILCISIIKENQVPKIIVTLIMTIFFFYVNYLLIKEYFNINFVQKLSTCILEICSFFLTKCWFQSLLIKVVYLMSITPKCIKLILLWLHNFTSLKHYIRKFYHCQIYSVTYSTIYL